MCIRDSSSIEVKNENLIEIADFTDIEWVRSAIRELINEQNSDIEVTFKEPTEEDIEKVFELRNKKLVEMGSLDKFIIKAYNQLQKHKAYLWGVYPTPNEFYMYNRVSTDRRFIIGVMHGYINRHDKSLYPNIKAETKEDYHQTILFYDKDGSVIRFNNVAFKTKPNAAGGLGKDRFDKNEKAAEFLAKKYPKIVTKKRRKNGTAEIILNKTLKNRR